MIHTEVKFGEVHNLASQVESGADNVNGGVSLVAFKAGQKLDTHTAPAQVMINVLEGEIEFTMLGNPHIIRAGEFMLMGEEVPHSVLAKTDSKLMLIKVKP